MDTNTKAVKISFFYKNLSPSFREAGAPSSDLIIFIARLLTLIQIGLARGLGLRLGDMRESGETGDSKEEEETQWRQVITSYTRIILRTFVVSIFSESCTE